MFLLHTSLIIGHTSLHILHTSQITDNRTTRGKSGHYRNLISDAPGLISNKSTIISLVLNIVFYLHTLRRETKVRSKTSLCVYDITERCQVMWKHTALRLIASYAHWATVSLLVHCIRLPLSFA